MPAFVGTSANGLGPLELKLTSHRQFALFLIKVGNNRLRLSILLQMRLAIGIGYKIKKFALVMSTLLHPTPENSAKTTYI